MYPDMDGSGTAPKAAAAEPAAVKNDGGESEQMKQIIMAQDAALKAQAAKIEDLAKQITALASREPAAAPAAEPEKSPQDKAWDATLAAYFGKKE